MLLTSFVHSFSFELGIPEGTGSLAYLFVVFLDGLSERNELMPAVWCSTQRSNDFTGTPKVPPLSALLKVLQDLRTTRLCDGGV